MEWVIIPLLGILGWVLGIVGFFKAQTALREVASLRAMLAGEARQEAVFAGEPPVAGAPPIPRPVPPLPAAAATSVPASPKPRKAGRDLEIILTQRWGVWLGAAALLLASVFLVRTAVEQGWLGPAARCAAAFVLGWLLLAGAEWLRRGAAPVAGLTDFGPAALAAGGVGAWFAASYGAGPLYDLVSPGIAFVLLGLSGLAGVALALRFGGLVGIVGLVAAFATPALVSGEEIALPGLFAYLLAVTAACWGVVRYTAWSWLGWCAAIGGACWVLASAASPGNELWAPGLFVPAAVALSLALLPGAALAAPLGRRLAWMPMALVGAAGLYLAGSSGDPTARLGLLLLGPVAVWKAWAEPRLAWLPHLAAALFLLVLLTWPIPGALPDWRWGDDSVRALLGMLRAPAAFLPFLETAVAMAAWYAASGLFFERRTERPVPWAALAALVPVATLGLAYAQAGRFQPPFAWAAASCALAAACVGAAWLARPGTAGAQRAGMYGAGAAAALALGLAILLDEGWLTMALALLLPALAAIESAADLPPLRRVALLATGLVLVRLVVNPYVLDYEVGAWPVLNALLPAYGVPALCFAGAARQFRVRGDDLLVAVLEAGACAFLALLAVLEIHHWASGGALTAFEPGLSEAALDVSALAAVAVLLHALGARGNRRIVSFAARIAGGVALVGGVVLIGLNPMITDEPVGASLLWNALLPAYAVPALLAGLAVWLGARPRGLLGSYALLAGFVWVTLTVRHGFHPDAMGSEAPVVDAELWAYSGAWLLFGAGLMAAGLTVAVLGTSSRKLRLTALALVGLTAAKVFLVDMAGLDGLWRVLSFLGLGVVLIGLSAVYRRFGLQRGAGEGEA